MDSRLISVILILHVAGYVEPDREFPNPKLWWTKQLTRDLYVGGRPSIRDLKYLCDSGFKSVISMFNFKESGSLGADPIPTAEEAKKLVEDCGMTFTYIWENVNPEWYSGKTVELFGRAYENAEAPVYFHCFQGYSASFTASTYLAQISNNRITVDDVLRKGAVLGYDWYIEKLNVSNVIIGVLGSPKKPLPSSNLTLPHWDFTYWWLKPIYGRFFVSGQFAWKQPELMKKAGIDIVVNLRPGNIKGIPEEVTLLNIHDNTGPGRQTVDKLLESRINKTKPNSYISPDSLVNYEALNSMEYGNEKGYHEPTERDAVENAGLRYLLLPIKNVEHMTKKDWENHIKPETLGAGNTLIHSRTGRTAAVFGLLAAGTEHKKDSVWALDQAAAMGYHFSLENSPGVYHLLRHVLDGKRPPNGAGMSSNSAQVTHQAVALYGSLSVVILVTKQAWTFV